MPLLWVRHEHLGLVGTRYGCGIAQRGLGQAGQAMNTAGFRKANPYPSDEAIKSSRSGNICRGETNTRIKASTAS